MVWLTSHIAFIKQVFNQSRPRGIDVSNMVIMDARMLTVSRPRVSCLQCIRNWLNRKKYNITKLIHRMIYSSISKPIEIKVQCAVITKYYFVQNKLHPTCFMKGKILRTYIHNGCWCSTMGCNQVNSSRYMFTDGRSLWWWKWISYGSCMRYSPPGNHHVSHF